MFKYIFAIMAGVLILSTSNVSAENMDTGSQHEAAFLNYIDYGLAVPGDSFLVSRQDHVDGMTRHHMRTYDVPMSFTKAEEFFTSQLKGHGLHTQEIKNTDLTTLRVLDFNTGGTINIAIVDSGYDFSTVTIDVKKK